jgi:hypothetical protein
MNCKYPVKFNGSLTFIECHYHPILYAFALYLFHRVWLNIFCVFLKLTGKIL